VTRAIVTLCLIAAALPTTAPAAPATKFPSHLYGYSIALPGSHWRSSFAIVTWSSGSPEPNSPEFDTFTDLRTNRTYFIAARRLPIGATLATWTAAFIALRPPGCRTPVSRSSSTLSGTPARVLGWTCTDDYDVIAVTAVHDRRGYCMLVASLASSPHAADRRAFDAARRSFRFGRG
jgi:hypothetical protein